PTAASLAYGLGMRNDETRTVAVYDLGRCLLDAASLALAGLDHRPVPLRWTNV
ncbi:Hsp70 family protein, partial [Nocardioides sp.]|uniref:Hsp70 family protein n=1 Tax=Nocardioides sp. TaxID=35761 RepID=UPI0037C8E3F7